MSNIQSKGFTLLEVLLALAIGTVLMATISTTFIPLLSQIKQENDVLSPGTPSEQLDNFIQDVRLLSTRAQLVFPNALDLDIPLASFALQLHGSGLDTPADANGDGVAGVAYMDTSSSRLETSSPDISDDDLDGAVDEDPINGIDDDIDGLVDEDAGSNQDKNLYGAGTPEMDDNADGTFDSSTSVQLSPLYTQWEQWLPRSIRTATSAYHTAGVDVGFDDLKDDNEDGITDNNPQVTWSVYFDASNAQLICNTPLVTHNSATANGKPNLLKYQRYVCLDKVTVFTATREHSPSGNALIKLSIGLGDNTISSHTVAFQ